MGSRYQDPDRLVDTSSFYGERSAPHSAVFSTDFRGPDFIFHSQGLLHQCIGHSPAALYIALVRSPVLFWKKDDFYESWHILQIIFSISDRGNWNNHMFCFAEDHGQAIGRKVAHSPCAGTSILVRQHPPKRQGNYTFASSKWTCSSGRTFKKVPKLIFCQFSGLNQPHRWWDNFQSWQRRSRITSGQCPLQQLHLWGEGEFSRGAKRDCNSELQAESKGTVEGDFFIKHSTYDLSDAAVNSCLKSTSFCVLLKQSFSLLSPCHVLTSRKSYSQSHLNAQTFAFPTQTLDYSFPSRVCEHREASASAQAGIR